VRTSGRRFRSISGVQVLTLCAKAVLSPRRTFTNRSSVEKIWYDSNRGQDNQMPKSLAVRASNIIALVFFLVIITGPIWNFIPWSATPLSTLLGKARFGITALLCHLGLLLWPLALILFLNLIRQ